VRGNDRASACAGAYQRECPTLMHSCSEATEMFPRICCTIPQTLMHICQENAVLLSHNCSANTPNAVALGQNCCTDCAPVKLHKCLFAAKHVTRRCYADAVTLVKICTDANAQVSDADAQIL
jgi:hypothetical protein